MMTFRVGAVVCFVFAAGLPVHAEDVLPAETLARLKAATVYVKVEAGHQRSAGSGFVFHVQGRHVYIATSEHVVAPQKASPDAQKTLPRSLPAGKVTVVFASGTRRQRELSAAILFRDPRHDLALLQAECGEDLPPALAPPETLRQRETAPVYVLGYPLGEKLDPQGRNPAVTVGRGAVSSLREDAAGKLTRIQIEAEILPGNSGGPVVDGSGRLLGVTAAKLNGTRLGVVIPATRLTELMWGQFVEVGLYPKLREPGASLVCVNLLLFDPLQRIRTARVHWLPPEAARQPQQTEGRLADRKDSQSCALERGKTAWMGVVPVSTPDAGQATLHFQIVIQRGEGERQATPVFTYRWSPNVRAAAGQPLAEGELKRLAADLQQPVENYRPRRAAMSRLAAAEPDEPREAALALIRKALADPDVYVRESSARAWGHWSGDGGAAELRRRLREEDFPWVRWTLLDELARRGGDEAVRAIVEDLARDRASGFPARALKTLGPAAEKQVLPLLRDADAGVRAEACRVLGAIGTERGLDALTKAAQRERDPVVARAAREAIESIARRRRGQNRPAWPMAPLPCEVSEPEQAQSTGTLDPSD